MVIELCTKLICNNLEVGDATNSPTLFEANLNLGGSTRMDKDGQFKYYFVLRDHLGNTRVTFSDLNNDDEINEKEEIVQINNYYAFGLNMEGNWNGASGANKYQYNGKELNEDFGLNWNDYGRRFYDPAVGRFSTHDRFAEKYAHLPPYHYTGNNPVKFIDINGDSIGVQNEGSNHVSREAFATFASTKEGINYLSKFAKAGQVIAGHTYNKDGKYHQKGLNLHFRYENLEGATRGVTRHDDKSNITVVLDTDSKFIAVSDKVVHAYTGSSTYTEALFSKIVTLSHETFLHAELLAQDYLQDSKFNNSNIGKDILGNRVYTEADYQHMQVYNNENTQIFPGSSLKVATEANTILKLNFSPTQMEGIIWNYSGGNTTKMKK